MENQAAPAPPAVSVPTVQTDNPYGLAALWQTGDIIARSTLVILLIMSLASWYVILTKLWDQNKLKKSARIVEKQFWTAPSVKDGVERLKKGDEFRGIAEDGLRAASHHDGRLTDRIDLHEWITMSLQRAVDGVNSKLNGGLGLLATVGSTAPFVGLFVAVPAVWGYNWLLGRNKVLQDALRNFASDLHAYLVSGARMGSEGGGGARPAVAKAAREE